MDLTMQINNHLIVNGYTGDIYRFRYSTGAPNVDHYHNDNGEPIDIDMQSSYIFVLFVEHYVVDFPFHALIYRQVSNFGIMHTRYSIVQGQINYSVKSTKFSMPTTSPVQYSFTPISFQDGITASLYASINVNLNDVQATFENVLQNQNNYFVSSKNDAKLIVTPPEIYFAESPTTENILHVPMTESQGQVITGESGSVSIPDSALLEVAQPTPPPEITVKYTGTSVPTVTDTPVTRRRKRVK